MNKRADTCEQAEHSTCHTTCGCTGGSAFRCLGGFDMADIMLALVVGQ